MSSLQKILDLNPKVIYPAHGSVIDNPVDKLKEYIAHRLYREQQILHCLKESKCPLSAVELVEKIYIVSMIVEYPYHGLLMPILIHVI